MKEVDLKIMQPSKPKELYLKLDRSIIYVCEIIEKQAKKLQQLLLHGCVPNITFYQTI